MRRPLWAKRYRGAMQPKPSAVWNTPRAGDAWQIRRTYMAIREAAPPGPFCLATGQISPARAASSLCGLKWNTALVASGHRGQRWGKVKGRRFCAALLRFPTDNGKPSNLFTPLIVIGGFQMTEARVGYHKEVKTASFQGKSITVENLTPMLSPKARDKRKREIESCLYEVFVKYAPGRAQMH